MSRCVVLKRDTQPTHVAMRDNLIYLDWVGIARITDTLLPQALRWTSPASHGGPSRASSGPALPIPSWVIPHHPWRWKRGAEDSESFTSNVMARLKQSKGWGLGHDPTDLTYGISFLRFFSKVFSLIFPSLTACMPWMMTFSMSPDFARPCSSRSMYLRREFKRDYKNVVTC